MSFSQIIIFSQINIFSQQFFLSTNSVNLVPFNQKNIIFIIIISTRCPLYTQSDFPDGTLTVSSLVPDFIFNQTFLIILSYIICI